MLALGWVTCSGFTTHLKNQTIDREAYKLSPESTKCTRYQGN